jgi:ribosomal protein L37AE/L43A
MRLLIKDRALQQCPVCRRFKADDGYITIEQMTIIEFEQYKNHADRLNKTGINKSVCSTCDNQRVVRLKIEVQLLKKSGQFLIDYVLDE